LGAVPVAVPPSDARGAENFGGAIFVDDDLLLERRRPDPRDDRHAV
jgi:hypothetical protein